MTVSRGDPTERRFSRLQPDRPPTLSSHRDPLSVRPLGGREERERAHRLERALPVYLFQLRRMQAFCYRGFLSADKKASVCVPSALWGGGISRSRVFGFMGVGNDYCSRLWKRLSNCGPAGTEACLWKHTREDLS